MRRNMRPPPREEGRIINTYDDDGGGDGDTVNFIYLLYIFYM